jgi:chromosome segregation ATPase
MIHGRDQLTIIDQHIATAQNSVDSIHRRLEEAGQRLTEIRNQTAEEFRRLAKFRLDELTANRVIARLDETDRAVVGLMQRRSRELSELEVEIQQNLARQSELKSEREEAVRRRDELVTEIDRHAAELRAQLVAQEAYRTQEKNAREAAARAERAETKAAQAEADREEKGRPYREDALFMYLWNRRFLTPDYTGGGLTRALDGWVAKRIHYADARSNYFMLTELPLRLREHAERQKTIAAQESQKLIDLEEQALQVDGIRPKKEALLATKKEIESIEARVEAEEKRHEALIEKRAVYSAASDELSQQAIQLQVSEIRNDTLSNLYREAQATSRPDDDVIVSRIQGLMAEEQSLSAEIGNLQSELHRQQKSFQEIEELRRRFRRSGYDSGHSYFPGGLDLAALLALLLSGRASGGDVWGRIGREQEFRLPRQHRHGRDRDGGFFPGGLGGGGGLPDIFGGGSGGGGSIGGGGFRTGGGF